MSVLNRNRIDETGVWVEQQVETDDCNNDRKQQC